MRYRCLVLDHDDTVMDSTRSIHHPAFLDALRQMRPGVTVSLEDYFRLNFDPGFLPYCEEVLHFSPEELSREYDIWQSWVSRIVPEVFPGMARLIRRQVAEGGWICVVSHSVAHNILRDYAENRLPAPTLVYGWEQPRERRKPNPWPGQEIARQLQLSPAELLHHLETLSDLRNDCAHVERIFDAGFGEDELGYQEVREVLALFLADDDERELQEGIDMLVKNAQERQPTLTPILAANGF